MARKLHTLRHQEPRTAMPLPSKLDVLAAILAAGTGLAMVEDRNRSEIVTPQAEQMPDAMTAEACLEQAEYRRRAMRVTVILTGGMPDTDSWSGLRSATALCTGMPQTSEAARRDRP